MAELDAQAPAAWRQLEQRTEPDAPVLLEVFLSWFVERHKGRSYAEILNMLQVLTPLEETRAYRELVGIGMEKGKQEGLKEGKQEGLKEGKQEGLLKTKGYHFEHNRTAMARRMQQTWSIGVSQSRHPGLFGPYRVGVDG